MLGGEEACVNGVRRLALMGLPIVALCITEFVLFSFQSSCDASSKMSLNNGDWLLGDAIINALMCVCWYGIVYLLSTLSTDDGDVSKWVVAPPLGFIISKIAKFAWIIVGFIVLFYGNMDCLRNGEAKAVFIPIALFSGLCILKVYTASAHWDSWSIRL